MVTGTLGILLDELGTSLGVPNLHPDEHDSCLLQVKEGIKIQIELDTSGQLVILGIDLGPVPSGKDYIDFFIAALKANNVPFPRHGVFAFSDTTKHLILFEELPVQNLRGERIATEISFLVEKALVWQDALARRVVPQIHHQTKTSQSGGLFGL